jgi:hypothetical protein
MPPKINSMNFRNNSRRKSITEIKLLTLGCVISLFFSIGSLQANAETGKGNDIFRVAISVIGVDQIKTGDIVSIVSVNNHTKVTTFDAENLYNQSYSNASYAKGQRGLLKYIIDFPQVAISTGSEYNVCVFAVKTSVLACKGGSNSPSSSPEIVDLSY